jgi:hypothetical protein
VAVRNAINVVFKRNAAKHGSVWNASRNVTLKSVSKISGCKKCIKRCLYGLHLCQ